MNGAAVPSRRTRPGQPTLLLFDLGGVLVENVGFERLASWLATGEPVAVLQARWLASPSVRDFERGRTTPDEFAEAFVNEWAVDRAPAAFIAEFAGWPRGFFAGAERWIARLRGRYRVACLSNSNALHWARFDGFEGVFDDAFSSHLIGVVKPDAAAFLWVLDACGVPAVHTAFFDDSEANVEAARRLGMQAYHVVGMAALEDTMSRAGLLGA